MVKRPLLNQKSNFEEKIGRIRVARDFLLNPRDMMWQIDLTEKFFLFT